VTDPVLVLDSTVPVVYKRDLTCRAQAVALRLDWCELPSEW
jgi:hypothetical protein